MLQVGECFNVKKINITYQTAAITVLLVVMGWLIVPYFLQHIEHSKQEALELVAASVEVELEQAIRTQSQEGYEVDLWLMNHSKQLALEPWGETDTARQVYRFLDYLPPEIAPGLKSFDPSWLRRNLRVIYEGEGKFRVEIMR